MISTFGPFNWKSAFLKNDYVLEILVSFHRFLCQGETPLFLSAMTGSYDTARLLLLHGANPELHDRRGRQPMDMAREGARHQVLELLLAHQYQRVPVPIESTNEMLWEERALMYSQWVGTAGLPGRSASFSGIVGHRDMNPPPQKYVIWTCYIYFFVTNYRNARHPLQKCSSHCLVVHSVKVNVANHSIHICTNYMH